MSAPTYEQVEEAWYDLTKGELQVEEDPDLARLVVAMGNYANYYVNLIAAAQVNAAGETIYEVTAEEVARRIALCLSILTVGE